MKVLVTGGAGGIGRVVVSRFLQRGWQVRAIDRVPELNIPDIEYICGDLTDYAAARAAVVGCEAIAHLAALPSPMSGAGHEVYAINTTSTFNIYEAAAAEGIKRIAQASSINAVGCAWNIVDVTPPYFPIDEDHPLNTNDPYSLSKQVAETIGEYYWRRDGISSVSLRFPWVHPVDYAGSDLYHTRRQTSYALLAELLALPESERQARLAQARQIALEFRGKRLLEMKDSGLLLPSDHLKDDPLSHTYAFDRFNYWAIVDVRDAAQAFEKGLTADYQGHHPLFINAAHNWLYYDTQTLLRLFFPDVTHFKRPLSGSDALVSLDRARALIGFEPAYSVEQASS
jgi:nucleoside-diphosphate-sugar epimerase